MEAIKFVVIGGGGFLGRHLVEMLFHRYPQAIIRIFDKVKTFEPEDKRIEYLVGDITRPEDLKKAFNSVECVFHTASPAAMNIPYQVYYAVNVQGTENVIKACQSEKVPYLVYTSSASVVFEGEDLYNVEESIKYAEKGLDNYNKTKIMGEKLILEANGQLGTFTVALRPSGLFGPRDPLMWPRMMDAGKNGKLKFVLGDGKNKFDYTYIENVAHSHLCGYESLRKNSSAVGGQKYFITNDKSLSFWDMPRFICEKFGYPGPKYHLPFWLMYGLAVVVGFFVNVLSPFVTLQPTLVPIAVLNSTTTKTFNISRAKNELNYKPVVTLEEGLEKTYEWFSQEEKAKENKKKD